MNKRLFWVLCAAIWLLPSAAGANTLIRFSENAVVPAGSEAEDVVVINGSADVAGRVTGNVVALRGNITLRGKSVVEGDAITLGGQIVLEPGAVVRGTKVEIGAQIGWASLPIFSIGKMLLVGFFIKVVFSLLLLVLTLFIVVMWPNQVRYAAEEISFDLVKSSLVGLFAVALLIPLAIGFAITIVGLPIAAALIMFMLVAHWFGVTTIAYLVGHKLNARFSILIAVLIGLLTLKLIHFIPLLGGVLYLLAVLPGLGAILLTRFGTNEPWLGSHAPQAKAPSKNKR